MFFLFANGPNSDKKSEWHTIAIGAESFKIYSHSGGGC